MKNLINTIKANRAGILKQALITAGTVGGLVIAEHFVKKPIVNNVTIYSNENAPDANTPADVTL